MKLTSASPNYWLALACMFPICVTGTRADAQAHGGSPLSVAMEQISRGDFGDGAIGVILQYHGVEAIPGLQKQFELAQENAWPLEERKDEIAVALVELHAEGDVYWNYLGARVQSVLDCDAPDPFVYDAQGKVVPDRVSPQFGNWAKEHHVDPDKMAAAVFWDFPERVLRLASTGDSRAVTLLRSALASRFPIVQVAAAAGLAKLHDNASVPLVIDAYKRGGRDTRFAFAMMALAYFDDPAAQQLAKSVLPPEVFKQLMEEDRSKEPF